MCGKFGHKFEGCWLLDRGKNYYPRYEDKITLAQLINFSQFHAKRGDNGRCQVICLF